jgi:hypothetical protein
MGRSVTPKYAVEFSGVSSNGKPVRWTPQGWNSKQAGRPAPHTLAAFVKGYEASTLPGGVNAHLGVTRIAAAQIKLNVLGGIVVASYLRSLESPL